MNIHTVFKIKEYYTTQLLSDRKHKHLDEKQNILLV